MWGSKLGPARNFSFIAPEPVLVGLNYDKLDPTDDFIYIGVDGYIWKMIPENCFKNRTFP
jgi:hypothetical protein